MSIFLFFSKLFPQIQIFKKTNMLEGNAHEYVYKISSRYLQKWLRYNIKHVKNRHFSRHFGTFP